MQNIPMYRKLKLSRFAGSIFFGKVVMWEYKLWPLQYCTQFGASYLLFQFSDPASVFTTGTWVVITIIQMNRGSISKEILCSLCSQRICKELVHGLLNCSKSSTGIAEYSCTFLFVQG